MCGNTRKDKIKKCGYSYKVRVAPIEDKKCEKSFRWFGHVGRRLIEVPLRRVDGME